MASEQPEETGGITAQDIAIDLLYVLAIGINVYIIADQLSDGALSRELSLRWTRFQGRMRRSMDIERQVHRLFPQVLWQAMETVEPKEGEL